MRVIFISILIAFTFNAAAQNLIITTDINNAGGDPDDKQSLIHLLWYADQLNIIGIIPDAWESKGDEATMDDLHVYSLDYKKYHFGKKGYPHPDSLKQRVTQICQTFP
jgi:hypothetical protein